MRGERFVVLGLAHARSAWFRGLAHWATSAAIPVEFVQTVSIEELRARLNSGRAFSAVVVDGGLPGVDRDLLDTARHVGCGVIVVGGSRSGTDWRTLGADAVLPSDFDRHALLDALESSSRRVGRGDEIALVPVGSINGYRAPLVGVIGSPGAGSSTVAMALAQGLGRDPRYGGLVLLADLALDADLAALHDARDTVPGVAELVEAHRGGHPSTDEIRAMTFRVPSRDYHVLLGLRRHRDWTALRPRSFEAALDGMRRSFSIVVADVEPDLECEADCGSVEVEERNLMARTTVLAADVVVAVGEPGLTGTLAMVRLLASLADHGVDATRVVPVLDRAPRSPKTRAELSRALAELVDSIDTAGSSPLAGPVFVPYRRSLDVIVRDVAALPGSMVGPVTAAVATAVERSGPRALGEPAEPVPVVPGSLGTWAE
jgi:hypothetical protein